MLRDALDDMKQARRLPEIVGERCVHAHIETARCRRCVDACPRAAWQLDDDMLGMDVARCDGCGLCVPACPEGALVLDLTLPLRDWQGQGIAAGACECAGLSAADGILPCLHALGLSDLLRLYRQGVGSLVVASGDCARCERTPRVTLDDVLRKANRLLMSRELPLMRLIRVSPSRWRALVERFGPRAQGPDCDRRGFLLRALRGGVRGGARIAGMLSTEPAAFVPPGTLLPGLAAQHLLPVVPRIDGKRCDGCDACARLCPHGAISLDGEQAGESAYRVEAARCTGCGICMDVCEREAVDLAYLAPVHQHTVTLRAARCRRCGADFHMPAARTDTGELCRICARVNHQRNLFQVVD